MGAFDNQRITVAPEFIDDLLAEGPAESTDPSGAAEAAAQLRKLVADNVDNNPGFLILRGFSTGGREFRKESLERISTILGDTLPQDASGTVVREVKDRGTRVGEGRTARYSDSRFGGDLHTDGAESPLPVPDYFTLYCVRQGQAGGALQLAPVGRVLERIGADSPAARTLSGPFHFDRRGDENGTEAQTAVKPVLFRTPDGRPAVTYLRTYIEIAHSRDDVPDLTGAQTAALDALDAALADPAVVIEDRLRPGELAVFDNLRMLHGRTEFTDGAEPGRSRLLYRTWIRCRAPRSAPRRDPVGAR
jgi:alpha-ketoglutarate-dependent taurine dioxygenase